MKRFLPLAAFVVGFLALGFAVFTLVLPHNRVTTAAIGGPFALTAPDGRTVTDKDMAGRPYLVFFGYTHCPDVCPASLAEISAVFKELGPDTKATALFISVDPERDTPAAMKEYMSSFDPRIIGLSGTPEATASVEKEFKAYSKKVPDKDGTYTMDHIALTYLMDKDGQFVGAFNLDQPAKDAAAELKRYF
jgi:protein SCO1/2